MCAVVCFHQLNGTKMCRNHINYLLSESSQNLTHLAVWLQNVMSSPVMQRDSWLMQMSFPHQCHSNCEQSESNPNCLQRGCLPPGNLCNRLVIERGCQVTQLFAVSNSKTIQHNQWATTDYYPIFFSTVTEPLDNYWIYIKNELAGPWLSIKPFKNCWYASVWIKVLDWLI